MMIGTGLQAQICLDGRDQSMMRGVRRYHDLMHLNQLLDAQKIVAVHLPEKLIKVISATANLRSQLRVRHYVRA